MDDEQVELEYKIKLRPILVVLALASGLVACTTLFNSEEWDEAAHGPVVPHDTFPADCSICHESGDWHTIKDDFDFDHEKETGVPLPGAHAQASCLLCHNDRGDVAIFAARGCAGCHEDTHRGNLGVSCDDCHDETTWRPNDSIAKHNQTRFPLVGAHAAAACFTCHAGAQIGNFEGLDVSCETCHQEDLGRATSPDHIGEGLTMDCQRCHIPTTWNSARFAHPPSFPLTGSHASLDCSVCHGEGNYGPLPTDCASCHLDDYQQTVDPNHITAGFSTDCRICHNTSTWVGATFGHQSWPLTGAHTALDCTLCHDSGVFAGTPTDCAACHLGDYQATTNPNHVSSGFGTNCATCHSTNTWLGAAFNHTFPIDSGPHIVLNCSDCHLTPSSPVEFSCVHCHEHSQLEMGDTHSEVSGYLWSSPSCLQCHPDGRH